MADRMVTPISAPQRGCLLVATPQLEDPNFRRSVVLLLEHGAEGSLGVILNRPSDISTEQVLPGWVEGRGITPRCFLGGPVQTNALVALVPTSATWKGLTAVTEQIALLDIEEELDVAQEDRENVCLYLGYSGWSQGQLQVELEEGAWWVFESEPDDLISDPFQCWSRVLSRQNSPARLIALHPDHSYLN